MTPAALRSAVERELSLDFAPRLIAWQRQHGRHGLPWQHTGDP
jgi:A/G-specific adenine glycosylase